MTGVRMWASVPVDPGAEAKLGPDTERLVRRALSKSGIHPPESARLVIDRAQTPHCYTFEWRSGGSQ